MDMEAAGVAYAAVCRRLMLRPAGCARLQRLVRPAGGPVAARHWPAALGPWPPRGAWRGAAAAQRLPAGGRAGGRVGAAQTAPPRVSAAGRLHEFPRLPQLLDARRGLQPMGCRRFLTSCLRAAPQLHRK
ncbi:hypothetical protein FOCC_FOCC011219, partial [Frankliniella occidentalis]